MTVLTHLAYALAYTIAGLSVGAALPYIRPGTDPLAGWLTGAAIILAGAVAQEVVTRIERERTQRLKLRDLERAVEGLVGEVSRLQGEVDRAAARQDEARRGGGGVDYDSVMQEVRLLQSLVGRLHERQSGKPPERPAADKAGRPAARKPVESGAAIVAAPPAAPAPAAVAAPAEARHRLNDAAVLDAVRDALKADRIDIYLQPIVSLPQRKHRFYEVFSRVRAADGSQIMPDRYLELAEREGLIATIDNLLLVRCIQLIRETERRQHHIGFFSNISAATVGDADFMRQFLQYMAQNQALVPKLVFEMSQEDWSDGNAATRNLLGQLAKLGFRFSMDQVGDLALDVEALVRAEVRYVKLDRALLLDPDMAPRVAALRRRLEGHPVDLIVEKIETENQLIELLDMGIDFGQGYLFGEPRLSRKPG